MGANNASAIATLVERSTRYVMLAHLSDGDHTAEAVKDALVRTMLTLPAHLRGSLNWDQCAEVARHKASTIATDIPVYFRDPASPWQRGTNENTNGLLRQFFPEGTDLSAYGQDDLDHVAQELNGRTKTNARPGQPSRAFDSPAIQYRTGKVLQRPTESAQHPPFVVPTGLSPGRACPGTDR
jgi:IS30 family transposase